MVRPNAEIIPSEHSLSVKIVTQTPVSNQSLSLVSDRFLVQLSKLENPPTTTLTAEEIALMWDKIDKAKLVQYKLKVDLAPEVQQAIKAANGGEVIPPNVQKQNEVFNSLKGTITDKMVSDSRDSGKKEESKEKPDVAMRYANKSGKGYMEDIKEQDSEHENAPTVHKTTPTVDAVQQVSPSETIQRKISEAQTKKYSL